MRFVYFIIMSIEYIINRKVTILYLCTKYEYQYVLNKLIIIIIIIINDFHSTSICQQY